MTKPSASLLTIFAGTGATVLVLLIALWISFQRIAGLSSASNWKVHSYQVLLENSRMQGGLNTIQNGVRDYLESGDAATIEQFNRGRRDFSESYKKTQQAIGSNATQRKRMALLKRQYLIWMRGHIEPLIKLRRSTRDTARVLRQAERTAARRRIVFATMGRTISQIERMEVNLLAERSGAQATQVNLAKTALILNGLFAIALAAGLSIVLASNTRKLEKTNQQLTEQLARREIGERKAEILSSHNEMILRAMGDGIAGVNQAGRTTFFNPAAEALTGFTAAEVIGKLQHDMLHRWREDGSPYPPSECPINATLKDGRPRVATEVFWHKNNTPVPVEYSCAPIMSSDEESEEGQRQVGAVVVFRDVSARRRSEARLYEMRSLVENAEDAIIVMNLEGVISSWNQGATKLYGYTAPEMINQYTDKLVPSELTNELPSLIQRLRREEKVELYEAIRFHKDGRRIRVAISLSPIKSSAGEVIAIASISRQVVPPHFATTV